VRTAYFSAAVAILSVAVAASACASAPRAAATSSTSTTAGEVSSLSSEPAARELSPEVEASGKSETSDQPGQLACRTKSAIDGTSELYLEWNGTIARGVLKRVAPSGMVYVEPVKAERYKGAIIAGPPESIDLATHAAVVGSQNGKQYMRVGDSQQAWTACE
jgi:hypothetical protein